MDLRPEDEAALVAYADDRLPDAERSDLERRMAADPALARAAERQRAAVRLLRDAAETTSAPVRLRAALESGPAPRKRTRRTWTPGWLGFAVAGAAAVLIAAVLLTRGGLTVDDALAAATRGPEAPPPSAARPALLALDQDGVAFPDYAAKFGWRAIGRSDEGRLRTVFYGRGEQRIAYSIVAGDPIDDRAGRRTVRDGVELHLFERDGRTVVTWRRQGHTCVLSGDGVPAGALLELAAWKGKGAVRF